MEDGRNCTHCIIKTSLKPSKSENSEKLIFERISVTEMWTHEQEVAY